MWLKELFAIVILTSAKASSTAVFLPSNKNLTNLAENFSVSEYPTGVVNLLNDILKSFNWSIARPSNNLHPQIHLQTNAADILEYEKSLAFLFRKCIATNWQTKYALQVIASAANDVRVYEILYEILWQELRSDPYKANPLLYLELYEDLESLLTNTTSEKLQRLHEDIQIDLAKCSATVLQSFFIQKTTVEQLLLQLKNLNNLYQRTVPRVFESLNNIEDQWQIAKVLLEFDSNTPEAVFNHISFLKYLKSHHEVIPYELYNNLERLVARQNFVNISGKERQTAAQLLPLSMGRVFASDKICIRNTTTPLYLYECPQTYLMCTNFIANNTSPANRKQAVFELQRIDSEQFLLRSRFWSRYLHLQISNLKNVSSVVSARSTVSDNTTIAQITKNLYSSSEASSWFIRFRGDFATIQDSTGDFYVCGGNPSYWSTMEKHAYTRQSMSSNEIQRECLWLLEDCSDVTA